MQKSTRTMLFFSLFAIFIIIAPAIIAYSQGYRLDLENKSLVKTGGLFFEARPAPIELFINGEFEKRSNFVFQNIFIGDLLPRTYLIEVKKEGYFTWRKALAIKEKLVTEVKNLILFPMSPKEEKLQKNIETFSPHNSYLSIVEKNTFPSITLYDKKNQKDTLVLNNLISKSLKDLSWNKDANRAIFNTGNSWVLVSTNETEKSINISNEISSSDTFLDYTLSLYRPYIDDIKWGEGNNNLFFLARDARTLKNKVNILFSYNISNKKLSSPLTYNVLNYQLGDGKLIYVSSILGDVHSINLENQVNRPLSAQSITSNEKDNVKLIIANEEKIIALVDNTQRKSLKDVYVYDKNQSLFKKISKDSGVLDAILSRDRKKLMLIDKNTISVYWLEEVHIQPFRESGDYVDIYTSNNTILSTAWFSKDNEHIFFSTKNGVWVIELDGRDKSNTHQISELPAQEMHYDNSTNTLYILSNNSLYSIPLN